jgi:hypothetical protein
VKVFEPNGIISVTNVPGYGTLDVPCHRTSFSAWTGEPVFNFGGKPLLDYDGAPVFAELLIQRLLTRDDWQAVCVECWANGIHYVRRPITSWTVADHADSPESVPQSVRQRIAEVIERARTKPNAKGKFGVGSAPDIVAWSTDGQIRFLEAKRKGKDAPNDNQKRFLSALLDLGYGLSNFTIVEWREVKGGIGTADAAGSNSIEPSGAG